MFYSLASIYAKIPSSHLSFLLPATLEQGICAFHFLYRFGFHQVL